MTRRKGRLKKMRTFTVLAGGKPFAKVMNKQQYNRLLGMIDRSKAKIKLRAD